MVPGTQWLMNKIHVECMNGSGRGDDQTLRGEILSQAARQEARRSRSLPQGGGVFPLLTNKDLKFILRNPAIFFNYLLLGF